jgi:xanthine dehydrogenase accessory factor
MREILTELTAALDRRQPCVYCAVVETRGSTPQKAGAAMLVFADGGQRGTLGGGCVEAEVKQRALRVLNEGGGPALLTFHLDDDYGWDDGLICGGRMSILADPLADGRLDNAAVYYRQYLQMVTSGRGCVEAAALTDAAGLHVGDRFLFDADAQLAARLATSPPPDGLARALPALERRPGPLVQQGVCYLPTLPRVTLVIVGGGHVGQAVGRLAAEVDFDVWALDDRASFVSAERFPRAQRRLVGEVGPVLQELAPTLGPSHYCLIVTRGHNHDEEALYHLAPTAAGYVGMIGSKRKIKMIFEDLLAKGVAPAALEAVHAPLGLPIGSQTVPEIAVSIVAELIARRNLGDSRVESRARVPVRSAR